MADTPSEARALQGVGVVVTRPKHQAGPLARLIENAGGEAFRFPTLEIVPTAKLPALDALLHHIDHFDIAIFVSPNAVEHGFARLRTLVLAWPTRIQSAAVGEGTARALTEVGIPTVIAPRHRFDSEALLAEPVLADVKGKRIMIFRGESGRALLGDTLKGRGAEVVYAECYRRRQPSADIGPLMAAWRANRIHVVSITSTEGLDNLYAMTGTEHRAQLLATPVVVLSQSQAQRCRELGFARAAIVAPVASDEAILETIKTWRRDGFSL